MRRLDAATVVAALDAILRTMVGGEPVHPGTGVRPAPGLHAWVDVVGPYPVRTVLSAGPATAAELTRALADVPPTEELGPDEVHDALGELANMLAGQLKAARAAGGDLGLPHVAHTLPSGEVVLAVDVQWRSSPLRVTVLGTAEA